MNMERPPKQELGPEELDAVIEQLLKQEGELFAEYIELYGEPGEDLEEREYWVAQEALVGKDREQAKQRLEEFIAFLEEQILKKKNS